MRFSRRDTPLGKCDRCQRTFRHGDLKPDTNYKNLLVCDTCFDLLDPFIALLPYQQNLDTDLAVINARPLTTVVLQQQGLQVENQPTVLMTEDGDILEA